MASPILDPVSPYFDLQLNLSDRVMILSGGLDAATAPLLLASITSMLNQRPGRLSLDLRAVTSLHPSVIAVITEVRDVQHDRGHKFQVINSPAALKRTLLATGLGSLL